MGQNKKPNSFLAVFGVHPKEVEEPMHSPWIFLKRKNRWVNTSRRLYNKEDLEALDNLVKNEERCVTTQKET